MERKHQYDLCAVIEGILLPMMDDPAMAAQEPENLHTEKNRILTSFGLTDDKDHPDKTKHPLGQVSGCFFKEKESACFGGGLWLYWWHRSVPPGK